MLNKADLLDETTGAEAIGNRIMPGQQPVTVTVSARTGQGLGQLQAMADTLLPLDPVTREIFRFPVDAGQQIHLLHEYARIIHKHYDSHNCIIEANVPESVRRRLKKFIVAPAYRDK